jgi:acylphosphatase
VATIRVHLYVSGRVQGVNYRAFVKREALRLGLTGWVRNLPDRRVEVVAEGEEEQVERLVQLCEEGPPLAIVRNVEARREPLTGSFSSFSIRY